jgi:outer membrane receptor protein involved in Fe transport
MPQFDTYRDGRAALASGNDLVQDIDQYEVGFKWATDNLSLYATGFYTDVDPRAVVFVFGGDAILTSQSSHGVELDAIWRSESGFSVAANATWLESEISSTDPSIDGNETERQPNWQVRLTPAYDFNVGSVEGSVYATYTAVDDRWGEALNVNVLEGYETLDLGVYMRLRENFLVQVAARNVTDEQALTESDPRTVLAPNGRYIMPRSIEFSVGYEF